MHNKSLSKVKQTKIKAIQTLYNHIGIQAIYTLHIQLHVPLASEPI